MAFRLEDRINKGLLLICGDCGPESKAISERSECGPEGEGGPIWSAHSCAAAKRCRLRNRIRILVRRPSRLLTPLWIQNVDPDGMRAEEPLLFPGNFKPEEISVQHRAADGMDKRAVYQTQLIRIPLETLHRNE